MCMFADSTKYLISVLVAMVLLAPLLYLFIKSNSYNYTKVKIIYFTSLWTVILGLLGPVGLILAGMGIVLLAMYLLFEVIPNKLDKKLKSSSSSSSSKDKKYNFYENNSGS